MRIKRLGRGDDSRVSEAGSLFDNPADPAATADFLARPDHYLFVAYEGEAPAGFVSGVLLVHPDKGREMFLYELAVAEAFRRRGGLGAVGWRRRLLPTRGYGRQTGRRRSVGRRHRRGSGGRGEEVRKI